MNFCSDNTTGAAPEVMAALEAANVGPAMPYGADDLTARVEGRFQEVFETDAAIFMVGTGTAANSLCLSVMAPPYGAVFCHPESHIMNDECGAPEFFTGGAKLMPLPDHGGKITAADLSEAIDQPDHGVHAVQAACVSLTQSS
jgi:threonine aldolase